MVIHYIYPWGISTGDSHVPRKNDAINLKHEMFGSFIRKERNKPISKSMMTESTK